MRRSKLYRNQFEVSGYERYKYYSMAEAIEILKKMPHHKFDETVELAFKLGVDTRQSDQNVRGAVALPKGTGKAVRVAVVAADKQAEDATNAGADFVGFEDLISKIQGGWLDFDVLIATPAAMAKVRPLGRVLGPRGLMPNPKTGTVTDNVGAAVKEAKGGRVEYRADKGGCVHVPIGKLSFVDGDLIENSNAIIHALNRARPATARGTYMITCTLSSTMSPGIKIDTKDLAKVII